MDLKYIKTINRDIIIFPPTLQHKDFIDFQPISAGFLHITTNEEGNPCMKCYGESVSLGLKSQEEDSDVATRRFCQASFF